MQFFQNLKIVKQNTKLKTEVNGVKIKLTHRTIHKALDIPDNRTDEWDFDYDEFDAYSVMTTLPSNSEDPKQKQLTSFNTNTFPPLQRLIHHIFTTIITPQGGGRCKLTETQMFLFYCLFKKIQVSLP